jgi:hypothetical protein
MMSKNVMIPLSLLDRIIELLNCWDVSEYSPITRYDYDGILWALQVKKQKTGLLGSYAKIILADDPEARETARIEYFRQQRQLVNTAEANHIF